ncbi:MAG: GatB/YqeY domain-containing protein [Candidatus Dojkabacteria bacterium]|nr:GatB/YqeY domain-containing protein [Candidatus Dojkabacteria bacterium]
MSLLEQIRKDMISSLKDGDKEKNQTLKMILATIKNAQLESSEELKDTDIEKILRKETKKIEDSISQYTQMGRDDLVSKEKADLEIINAYLPELMSDEDVKKIIESKINELGAQDMRDMGRVMGTVMKELDGKADGNTVKNIVQQLLS